jgi:hypothetical protein
LFYTQIDFKGWVLAATQEAKIWRIAVRNQPGQIVPRGPISDITQKGLVELVKV